MSERAGLRRARTNRDQPRLQGGTSVGASGWRIRVVVLLGYVLLTLIFTRPLVTRFGSELIGRGNDLWIFQWNNWWVREALSQGLDVYHTPDMFYPRGVPLYFHSFSWFNSGLWLVLSPLTGAVAAHNLTVVLGYVLSGYTTYLLTKELTGSEPGAFLAGTVFAFFRHRGVNHLHLFSIQWIPLTVLLLIRLERTGRLPWGLWAGVSMALAALCGWQQLLLLGFWVLVWFAYSLVTRRWENPGYVILGVSIALCACALLTAPLLWPILGKGLLQGEADLVAGALGEGGTDLLTYLVPGQDHPLVRLRLWREGYEKLVRVGHTHNFAGFVALGLVVWALGKQWSTSAFWGFVALSSAGLAVGPVLEANGVPFPHIPMPYRLLESTLIGSILRRPARLNTIFGLGVAVMAGIGAGDVLERLARRPWLRIASLLVLVVALFFEHSAEPFPSSKPYDSPFFELLRDEAGQFAVADFPIGYLSHDKWYMYAQTLHERPMVGGHVSRVPSDAHDFMDDVPILREARVSAPKWGELDDISRQMLPLAEVGVKYVIVHKDRASSNRTKQWRNWFVMQPYYEDQQLLVFRTAPRHGRDFQFLGGIGDGLGVISAELSTSVLPQEGLLEARFVWGTGGKPSRDWHAYLALRDSDGRQVQRVTFEPCPGWRTANWGRNALARGVGYLQVDPFVRRGTYSVVVGLLDPVSHEEASEPIPVGQLEVQAIKRTFDVPKMTMESKVTFGTVLELLGYDLQRDANQLELTLHWKALRRMEESYTFFVHLINVENGELVAQADVIPRDWTYPTIWWEANEVVSDDIVLPLVGLSPAAYRLELGVYDGDTGERLHISDGSRSGSDRYVVPKAIHVP